MLTFKESDLILVTGASSGIGRATTLLLNSLGVKVIAIGRNVESLASIKKVAAHCDFLFTEVFDLAESIKDISPFIKSLVTKYDKISGFVHSAGALRACPLRSEQLIEQHKLFDLNFFSALEIMKVLSNKRYRTTSLSCVLLASIAGLTGNSALTAYGASKSAIIAAVKSLAKELGSGNIRVNAVSPGTIQTNISRANPSFFNEDYYENIAQKWVLPYSSTPEHVANLIVFLLSNASEWITGQNIVIDGGESL